MNKRHVLIIAPFPPPFNGNSLPVKEINDYLLASEAQVTPIDLNKKSLSSGVDSMSRIFQIITIFKKVWKNRNNKDLIYFTLSESFAGNLKDLFIYLILYRHRGKVIVHMLGGAGMKEILRKKHNVFSIVNKFFISKLAGVIVEGNTQKAFFSKVIGIDKIHVIPNFAEDFLFISKWDIESKFSGQAKPQPLKVLFLSNLIFGKGHEELAAAYLKLPLAIKHMITIDFAGAFDYQQKEEDFKKLIEGEPNLTYHGSIKGDEKLKRFQQSHIFCLPTYYPYEGQPFSILEAYATGCVVVTTNHSGIFDVFDPNSNGFEVKKGCILSLISILEMLAFEDLENLKKIALNNLHEAERLYNKTIYLKKINHVFTSVADFN